MIGNDCVTLENNIDTFLNHFILDANDTWESEKSRKLRHILILYKDFRDLAKDIRSLTYNEERVHTFADRAENYFKKFKINALGACTAKMPYLHILRHHLGHFMTLYGNLFGWGYGYFSTNAGEHLNKRIKHYESTATNLQVDRFYHVIRMVRMKQFVFTKYIFTKSYEVKCSACGEFGHNRKNKMCPLHESHPRIDFEDTDVEDN